MTRRAGWRVGGWGLGGGGRKTVENAPVGGVGVGMLGVSKGSQVGSRREIAGTYRARIGGIE